MNIKKRDELQNDRPADHSFTAAFALYLIKQAIARRNDICLHSTDGSSTEDAAQMLQVRSPHGLTLR